MDRIEEVAKGQKILAKWANKIVQEIRRLKIIPGPGIRTTVTSDGTIVNVDANNKTESTVKPTNETCFPVFITSYAPNQTYKGAQYRIVGKNYSGNESDGKDDPLYFPHVTPQTRLPLGCTVLAHRISAPLMVSSNDELPD